MNTLKITQHNDFVIYLPLVVLNSWGKEAVVPTLITDVEATINRQFGDTITIEPSIVESFMVFQLDKTLNAGKYNATIKFKYEGRDVAKNIKDFFEIVEYDHQSNWRDYIVGDHVELCTQAFIAGSFLTDADYERLKAELSQAIAAAEAAKEEYIRKAAELDGVAQQGDDPNVSLSSMDSKLGNMVVASQAEVAESLEYINSQLV